MGWRETLRGWLGADAVPTKETETTPAPDLEQTLRKAGEAVRAATAAVRDLDGPGIQAGREAVRAAEADAATAREGLVATQADLLGWLSERPGIAASMLAEDAARAEPFMASRSATTLADVKAPFRAAEQSTMRNAEAIRDVELARRTVLEYMSYLDLLQIRRDVPALTPAVSRNLWDTQTRLNDSGNLTHSERKYGAELHRLRATEASQVDALAHQLQRDLLSRLRALGLTPSPYSLSPSWVYWDFGKQSYLNTHPGESDARYHLGEPLRDHQVQRDIVDRHLGWELHQHWRGEGRTAIERRLRENPQRERVLALLNNPGKATNGTLSSSDLTELGRLLAR